MSAESKRPRILQAPVVSVVIACLVAMALKAWLVIAGLMPFNSDEAVVALMARHILQGHHPVFFYGQAYMGSLDAYLVAIGFWLFGQSVWVIRLVQACLYLAVMLSTVGLARLAYGTWHVGAIAVILLAIPTVNMTLYTTASLGGYGEALLIGNLILLITLSIQHDWRRNLIPGRFWKWGFLGFLSGFGLWVFGLTLIFSGAAIIYLFLYWFSSVSKQKPLSLTNKANARLSRRMMTSALVYLIGAIAGSSPWWGYALKFGVDRLIRELGGGAIAGVEQLPYIVQIWQHLINLVLLGSPAAFGFRPPWDVTWLALPLIPVILFFWVVVLVVVVKQLLITRRNQAVGRELLETNWVNLLWILIVLFLVLGFVLSPFGADPSGRYFVPLAVPLVLLAAWSMGKLKERYGRRIFSLVGLVLIFNLWGTIQCAQRYPPGFTTQFYALTQIDHRFDQELIQFLEGQGETYGYSNYWVGYPLAFLSQEEIIYVPALPYHLDFRYTQRDDRYQPYREMVNSSGKVAYITTRHPPLEDKLRHEFRVRGINWQEAAIGDYHVFYALSELIRPEDMGLGMTTRP